MSCTVLLQRGEVVGFHVSLLLNPVSSRNPASSGCQERLSRSLTSSPAGAALSRSGRLTHVARPSVLSWHPVRSQDYSPHRGRAQPIEALGLELATVGAGPSSSLQSGCGLLCSLMDATFPRARRSGVLAVLIATMAEIFVPRQHGSHSSHEAKACLGD